MMKLPLAIGLFSLLPLCAGAAPVSTSPAGSMSTLAGAQHGLAFGGFFTLYSFAVAGPLPRAETGAPMLDLPAQAEPEVGHPPSEGLADDLDPVPDLNAPPTARPVKPGRPGRPGNPAFVLAGNDAADPLGQRPLPGAADPLRPWGLVPMASANEVPEPSTLLLAALAVLALQAASGRRRAAAPADPGTSCEQTSGALAPT